MSFSCKKNPAGTGSQLRWIKSAVMHAVCVFLELWQKNFDKNDGYKNTLVKKS